MIPEKTLDDINTRVNQMIEYRRDRDVHHAVDKWQTPAETLKLMTGDCEDFAILKAWMLVQAGYDPGGMRIAVVRVAGSSVNHAVLYCDSQQDRGMLWWKKKNVPCTLILDNMTGHLYRPDQVRHSLINLHAVERFFDDRS